MERRFRPSVTPPSLERRWAAAQCALGRVVPDMVLANGVIFNSVTGEFIPNLNVWIKEGLVARVTEESAKAELRVDLNGMVVIPGLLDTHTHVYGQTGVDEFVRYVLPTGVTTVVAETDELPRIIGRAGYELIAEQIAAQPLRFYYTLAPLSGLTPEEEATSPGVAEIADLLADPRCVGLGEAYWNIALLDDGQGARVRELMAAVVAMGKRAEGHTAGARDDRLQAYIALGPSSCHEPITEAQVLDRLRLGLWTMVRQGGVRKELGAVAPVFFSDIDLRRLVLVTDGQYPRGFLDEGYLDGAVRTALAMGIPPARVYQSVTINAAEHFGLGSMLGSFSPGAYADAVVIPSPDDYRPQAIFCEGRMIYEDGRALVDPQPVSYPPEFLDTVKTTDDWEDGGAQLWASPPGIPLRALELVSRLVAKEAILDPKALPSSSTAADDGLLGLGEDVLALLAVDRLRRRGAFWGLIKGFGLKRGACGTTICWDTADLLAVGCDRKSMRTVVRRLNETGGGIVYAVEGQVVAELVAPFCGIVSLEPMREVAEAMEEVERALAAAGVPWENPLLTLSTLATAAIPFFRITHRGYLRVTDRALLPLEVS